MKKNKKKILFLGYGKHETCLHDFLNSNNCQVQHTGLKEIEIENYDLVISFGYRHIIPRSKILSGPPIINLHIGYLPYNKGSHPNFWSHIENTPSGVTIHLIDEGVDTGPYLYQKMLKFDTSRVTFRESYNILINEIENLFIKNFNEIIDLNFKTFRSSEIGTYHSFSDLPKKIDWDNIIDNQIKILKKE
jgi:methionyl-tRNA formyltransferase